MYQIGGEMRSDFILGRLKQHFKRIDYLIHVNPKQELNSNATNIYIDISLLESHPPPTKIFPQSSKFHFPSDSGLNKTPVQYQNLPSDSYTSILRINSHGNAVALQAIGHRFEPCTAHYISMT